MLKRMISVCLFLCIGALYAQDKHFVIVIPSYNNARWYEKNLDSVFSQKYDNYRVMYIDDASQDGTAQLVEQYIAERNQAHRVTLIKNDANKGALCNIFNAVYSCADTDIMVTLDGDDWFAHDQVLSRLNREYQNPNVWLTYGQYQEVPSGRIGVGMPMPKKIIALNAYRDVPWVTTALRTFYVWLFKNILLDDLQHDGNFYKVAWDLAFMFPMLEMAAGRMSSISDVLYVYNRLTPLNDDKIRSRQQSDLAQHIRSKERYQPLEKAGLVMRYVDFQQSLAHGDPQYAKALALKMKRNPLCAQMIPHLQAIYGQNISARSSGKHIPKIIHQVWLGSPLPERYKKLQESWRKYHPDWEYIVWQDADIEQFGLHNKDLYDQSTNYGERSDLARVEILERYGGLYVDTDFECYQSFDVLHEQFEFYAGMVPLDRFGILANGIMGSIPGHPILKRYIRTLKDVWAHKDICARGPGHFDSCFYQETLVHSDGVIAFPPSYFFPVTQDQVRAGMSQEAMHQLRAPETMAIHYWDGSWDTHRAQVKKQSDYEIISLGYRCQPAMQMRFNNLRSAAYPFDWLIVPFDSLCDLLENHFVGFLDAEHLEVRLNYYYQDDGGRASGNYPHIWEKKYNILMRHDFEFNADFMRRYAEVKEKYDRRIARFYEALASGKHIYFIRQGITHAQAERLDTILQRLFPCLRYTIVAIDFEGDIQTPWQMPRVKQYYMPLPVPYNRDGDLAAWCAVFQDLGLLSAASKPLSQQEYAALYKQIEKEHLTFIN